MLDILIRVLTPLLIVLGIGFLVYRFGFFQSRDVGGRISFISGGVILLIVALWEVVELTPDYPTWFLAGAYTAIDVAEYLAAAIGLLLLVVGLALYADYWQERREEVDERLARLSILDHLQHDSRQPYHFLELLNISLREILVHYPMVSGAVFLVNRARRQFVLTSSSGLHKEEVAYLEYYPLERNIISQAVELGDPMLAPQFEFIDRNGSRVSSRFKSVMVLPLVSGMERIGGLLLFSEDEKFFTAQDIRYLSPVAQWLAEKIKATRLARQLAQAETARQEQTERGADLSARFSSAARAAGSPEAASAFCRALVGWAEAESVHLCGLRQGELILHGGSEALFDLPEYFRAAVIEGMDRARPLIINQESTSETGPKIDQSSLIFPLDASSDDALLLIRSGRPFVVDDSNLKLLEAFARIAGLVIKREDQSRERLTRRRGFEVVLELLQTDEITSDSDSSLKYFLERVCRVLGRKTIGLALSQRGDSHYHVSGMTGITASEHSEALAIEPGEGGAGTAVATGKPIYLYGRVAITRHFETYHDSNHSAFQGLFGERGYPEFVAYCPLVDRDRTPVVVIGSAAVEESERGELERLLTLAAGLFSLRMAISQPRHLPPLPAPSGVLADTAAASINDLNNQLSALVGTAELASRDTRTHEALRGQLRGIIASAEKAADIVKNALRSEPLARPISGDAIGETIHSELEKTRLSGNLYLAGQRPREITLDLSPLPPVSVSPERLGEFFRDMVDRFAVLADDDDDLTIATYEEDNYIYLDISRHRRNFPSVGRVAAFGRYRKVEEAFRDRPADVFLKHLLDSGAVFAMDSGGRIPAFLSFRFPVSGGAESRTGSTRHAARLLAIDDQQVILDLISAMGHSLGYEVRTATTGEEGVALAEREPFDAVLTDLALPRLSGLEVARKISRFRPGVPIILVTGWATELSQAELASAGITEVLYKPFRIDQLTTVVRSVVSGRLST